MIRVKANKYFMAMARQKPIQRTGIKRAKYGNVKQRVDGRTFDSGLERDCYSVLVLLEKAGEIRNLQCQVTHQLYAGVGRAICSCLAGVGDERRTALEGLDRIYAPRLDFQFEQRKDNYHAGLTCSWAPEHVYTVWADAKGFQDAKQVMGYKLFEAIHGGPIRLYRTAREVC
jgi:hypothetical protein